MIDIPCSYGELIDKVTILRIKRDKITDVTKLANIHTELQILESKVEGLSAVYTDEVVIDKLNQYFNCLKLINLKLWDIEDSIRECERNKDFGEAFIELARSVYMTNDERSDVKRQINVLLGSRIVEEKSYKEYK